MNGHGPFHYYKASPEIIRLVAVLYAQFPVTIPSVTDPLVKHGNEISH